jgi:ABC transport system ATP-binding/permease protein
MHSPFTASAPKAPRRPRPPAERAAQLTMESVRTGKTLLELKKLGLAVDGK